jgi:hypothetical protein
MICLATVEFGRNLASLSSQFAASANRGFQLQKRGQLFIRPHNETLSVVAMRVNNPDRSPGVFFTAGIADEEQGLFGIITEDWDRTKQSNSPSDSVTQR